MINLQAVLLYSLLGKTVFDLWHLAEYNEEQKYMGGFAAGGRRMPADMKEIIANAARQLILEKKIKKLTVKDIVEECQITRQAFYYHFDGIPDLIQWSMRQGMKRFVAEYKEQKDMEAALHYFFVVAINAMPEVEKGMQSNYGKEIEQILVQNVYELFERVVEEQNLYQTYSRQKVKLIMRYHSSAILGLLREWTAEDTRNLDTIVHEVFLLMMGEIRP